MLAIDELRQNMRSAMLGADNEICISIPPGSHYDVIFDAAILTVLDGIQKASEDPTVESVHLGHGCTDGDKYYFVIDSLRAQLSAATPG